MSFQDRQLCHAVGASPSTLRRFTCAAVRENACPAACAPRCAGTTCSLRALRSSRRSTPSAPRTSRSVRGRLDALLTQFSVQNRRRAWDAIKRGCLQPLRRRQVYQADAQEQGDQRARSEERHHHPVGLLRPDASPFSQRRETSTGDRRRTRVHVRMLAPCARCAARA
eukprot:5960185-Pleurochrysis_carterae.AAC.1